MLVSNLTLAAHLGHQFIFTKILYKCEAIIPRNLYSLRDFNNSRTRILPGIFKENWNKWGNFKSESLDIEGKTNVGLKLWEWSRLLKYTLGFVWRVERFFETFIRFFWGFIFPGVIITLTASYFIKNGVKLCLI